MHNWSLGTISNLPWYFNFSLIYALYRFWSQRDNVNIESCRVCYCTVSAPHSTFEELYLCSRQFNTNIRWDIVGDCGILWNIVEYCGIFWDILGIVSDAFHCRHLFNLFVSGWNCVGQEKSSVVPSISWGLSSSPSTPLLQDIAPRWWVLPSRQTVFRQTSFLFLKTLFVNRSSRRTTRALRQGFFITVLPSSMQWAI